jgi:hypothetical protein
MIKWLHTLLCHFNKHTFIRWSYEKCKGLNYVRGWEPMTCKWCGEETKGLKYPDMPKTEKVDKIMKFCNECKYCGYNQLDYDKGAYYTNQTVPCLRVPPKKLVNLITGEETIIKQLHCWNERYPINPSDLVCGSEGKYFEAK